MAEEGSRFFSRKQCTHTSEQPHPHPTTDWPAVFARVFSGRGGPAEAEGPAPPLASTSRWNKRTRHHFRTESTPSPSGKVAALGSRDTCVGFPAPSEISPVTGSLDKTPACLSLLSICKWGTDSAGVAVRRWKHGKLCCCHEYQASGNDPQPRRGGKTDVEVHRKMDNGSHDIAFMHEVTEVQKDEWTLAQDGLTSAWSNDTRGVQDGQMASGRSLAAWLWGGDR